MTRHRSACGALIRVLAFGFFALFGLPRTLAESPQETALARSLFEEGVALADKSDWSGAADRFQRAYELKPTAGIAFNYASVLIELGKLVEASELLRRVSRDTSASEGLRRDSETKLAQVQPRIAYLTVQVEETSEVDAHVDLGAEEWPRVAWGVASPLDPGTYTARVVVKGEERARQQFTIQEGERRELTLTLSAPDARPEPAPGPRRVDNRVSAGQPPVDAPVEKRRFYKSWIFWTGVGAVVAGGVVAGVLLSARGGDEEAEPVRGNADPGVIRW